jgi:hypothetical protein
MTELKQLFSQFSSAATKDTGSSNQFDRQRWLKFLVACNTHSAKPDSIRDALSTWLTEDGWNEDTASELRIEFDFAMDLLNFQKRSN